MADRAHPRLDAYVVVGDDGHYCDAQGTLPDVLKNDAEWAFFQAGLETADLIILGRKSHEATPNVRNRRRLVLTQSVASLDTVGRTVLWNPAGVGLDSALAQFESPITALAVVGGQVAFDFFLAAPYRYARFHLSVVSGVTLPGGRPVFSEMETTSLGADQILQRAGYRVMEQRRLAPRVDVFSWG